MNLIQKRRTKTDPAQQRKAQEEVRRQIAVAVSVAEKRTQAETQAEVLQALATITGI
ncbi:hypothetical protein [Mesorhizobium sp. M7A.F.Ca.MR.362.00.0.0]|uniref:hypothetical protein n=1 Tax=Mesorhizobium sp. M7A.F.Ca.MR.362.00.0.0 TaxID=2496779 RepID=UPI0013E354B6|nr:hypothetical protein [Mesorhizobium sp. M7A.F.Ca.MR.362.00.0.0]